MMKSRRCFEDVAGFNDRWMLILGIPLAGVLISLVLFGDYLIKGNYGYYLVCVPISIAYTVVFWFGLRYVYYRSKIRFPEFKDIGKRVMIVVPSYMVLFFGVQAFDTFLLHPLMDPNKMRHEPNPIVMFITITIIAAFVITIYEALSFYLQLQRAVTEKSQLERHFVQSQLESLRNQVNPHFLFNSLNTLIYLIPEEPAKAVNFVQKLSKVYRYILESRDSKMIPLAEEMEFLQAYIYLMKERFGENLHITIQPGLAARPMSIVPLTLQILFENVIKHNVISTEKPLKIDIFIENNRLIMRNRLQRKNQVMDSTGVGLDNIRARYSMLTDEPLEVIASQDYFTVLLPVLENIHEPVEVYM